MIRASERSFLGVVIALTDCLIFFLFLIWNEINPLYNTKDTNEAGWRMDLFFWIVFPLSIDHECCIKFLIRNFLKSFLKNSHNYKCHLSKKKFHKTCIHKHIIFHIFLTHQHQWYRSHNFYSTSYFGNSEPYRYLCGSDILII